ncbi:FxLYD domain-containing protein [Halobellus ordinarius]|uniref:FxLYD domain-containing protein n=1 Tax=Halobellus ordinarius TaxID=3075120 RepID=UPI00288032A8|nr:FxLYD domain-containing protein [Halobellus sp. ZY16]
MKRRTFVATSGTALLAGCNSGGNEAPEGTPATEVTDSTSVNEQTTSSGEVGKIDIVETNWVTESESAEFLIQNIGEGPTGSLTLVARWYDDEGIYIGNDQISLPTLHSGKSWSIRVENTVPFKVADYDAYVDYESQYTYDELDTRSVDIDEEIPAITGIVSHEQEGETAINILAVTYNSGWITHIGSVTDTRIPDPDWRFYIPLSQVGVYEDSVGDELELMFTVG